jgi:T5SS/PEP-CTERM-associated repeat protein
VDNQGRRKNVLKEGATKEPGRCLRADQLSVCLGFALAVLTPSLQAADNVWTNLSGSFWDTIGAWSLGIRPTNSHNVFITNATTKTVTIDSTTSGSYPASLTIYNLSLWGPAGTINTLYLNNSGMAVPLTVSNDFTLSTGGVLRIANGAVNVLSSGSGQFAVDGVARLDTGTITVTNSLTVIGNYGEGTVTNSAGLMSLRDVKVGNAAGSEGRWFIAGGTNQLTAISYIGYSAGATGAVVVNGGRLLASNATLFVGYNGTGSLIMSNGLTMLDRAQIGFNSGGRGSVVLAGGTNQIFERTYLGFNAGGTGSVAISGGEWIATNDFSQIGYSSFGSFAVSNGLARLGRVYLGYNAGGEGQMIVAGGNTYATNALGTTLFEVRRGALTLTGGTLEVDQLLMTNTAEASLALFDGTLRTRGMTNAAAMVIGNGAGGRLDWELLEGTHWLGGALTLGDVAGATGAVTLLGGELIATNVATYVGDGGRGLLTITNASLLTTTNVYVGYGTTGTGVVTVAGDGSLWTVVGSLRVGWNSSSNRLAIISGGTVAALNSHVGYDDLSSNNSVLVSGNGSTWSNAEYLAIGQGGSRNSLVISNGGSVLSAYGRLGYAISSSNNTALVTGSGSIWSNSGSFRIGYSGSGNRLTITNGGWVISADGYLGTDANSSNNSALVTGAGSVWSNTANLYVGYGGPSNRLTIANAGRVYAPNLVVGAQDGADFNLLVNAGGYLFVTNASGTGVLDVRRGSLVLSGGTTTVDRLVLTNMEGLIYFSNGVLNTRATTTTTNGQTMIIGSGAGNRAMLNLSDGVHSFSNGLTVAGSSGSTGIVLISSGQLFVTNATASTVIGDTGDGALVELMFYSAFGVPPARRRGVGQLLVPGQSG